MIGYRKFVAIASATAALALGAVQLTPALATPGSGFVPGPIVTGEFRAIHTISHKDGRWPAWDLLFKTKADTDLGVDVLTVHPGGYSGWHSHAGPIYVTVKAGSVTWYDAACLPRTFTVGDTYIEPAHSVHFVENTGDMVATLVAVAPRPHGAPGRLDAPEPACAKQD
jgi:quercetin dioxygenase-like cupin family protein